MSHTDYTDEDITVLMDKRTQYEKDLTLLYDSNISDNDYWRVYHHINAQLTAIDAELKERNAK